MKKSETRSLLFSLNLPIVLTVTLLIVKTLGYRYIYFSLTLSTIVILGLEYLFAYCWPKK